MTLVSEIIERAFRETNLLGETNNPTPVQAAEGLSRLQTIVSSTIGNEAGDQLTAFSVGRANIARPQGFPWYDTIPDGSWFVPDNTRIMANLQEAISLYLTPVPGDGSRFAIIDVASNFATYNVTVYGNGRDIEASNSITLNTNGTNTEWFYRADLANWLKCSPLGVNDTFPFPVEFDDYFVTMLALRLSPAYGKKTTAESQAALKRSRMQITARYSQIIQKPSELGLLVTPLTTQDRYFWWNGRYYPRDPTSSFNSGYPW